MYRRRDGESSHKKENYIKKKYIYTIKCREISILNTIIPKSEKRNK